MPGEARRRIVAVVVVSGSALAACNGLLGIDQPAAVTDAAVSGQDGSVAPRDAAPRAATGDADDDDDASRSCLKCNADAGLLGDPSFECQMGNDIGSPWALVTDAGSGVDFDPGAHGVSGGVDHDKSDDAGPFSSCGPDDAWMFCYSGCPVGVAITIEQRVALDPGTPYTLSAYLRHPYGSDAGIGGFLGARDGLTGAVLGETAYTGTVDGDEYQQVKTSFTAGASASAVIYAGYVPLDPTQTTLEVDNFVLAKTSGPP